MDKKEIVLLIADQVEEWGDDNSIALSQMDMIELGERIFNLLPQIYPESKEVTMTDLEMLRIVLDNQEMTSVTDGNYRLCSYTENLSSLAHTILVVDTHNVGFIFSENGGFLGMFNSQE